MLQEAFKEQALSRARVFEWFSRFKNGDLSIEDQPRSGRPSSSRNNENITKIREKLNEDRRYTIDELSGGTGVSWSSVQRILTQDLGMRRVAAKFVPRLLTEDQWKS
jgi:AraC-like DNA-binding protein